MRSHPIKITALIPVKALALGKSRLSSELDLEARIQVTRESLRHIVHVLKSVSRIGKIIIISRDSQVAAWARQWRVTSLREQHTGLNEALRDARTHLRKAEAILVLPSDLVALSVTDIEAILDAAETSREERWVVIAPDRHGNGTNALLLRPPQVIEFEFGANSSQRHAALAYAAGVTPIIFKSDSISLDLDSPEDYALYWDQW